MFTQKPANGLYLEPDESFPHSDTFLEESFFCALRSTLSPS
jgi:hypothetical protein